MQMRHLRESGCPEADSKLADTALRALRALQRGALLGFPHAQGFLIALFPERRGRRAPLVAHPSHRPSPSAGESPSAEDLLPLRRCASGATR